MRCHDRVSLVGLDCCEARPARTTHGRTNRSNVQPKGDKKRRRSALSERGAANHSARELGCEGINTCTDPTAQLARSAEPPCVPKIRFCNIDVKAAKDRS